MYETSSSDTHTATKVSSWTAFLERSLKLALPSNVRSSWLPAHIDHRRSTFDHSGDNPIQSPSQTSESKTLPTTPVGECIGLIRMPNLRRPYDLQPQHFLVRRNTTEEPSPYPAKESCREFSPEPSIPSSGRQFSSHAFGFPSDHPVVRQ